MKPIILGLGLIFGGLIAVPSAQLAVPAQPSEPAHKAFLLTGCLESGPSETSAFKLTNAVSVGQAVAPPATSPAAKDVYELLPVAGLTEQGVGRKEMQSHAGKKVEVTLRPIEILPDAPPSSSTSATATITKVEPPAPQRYTVTNIKSIADACAH